MIVRGVTAAKFLFDAVKSIVLGIRILTTLSPLLNKFHYVYSITELYDEEKLKHN